MIVNSFNFRLLTLSSPKIFIAVFEMIISKVNWDTTGINADDEFIIHLRLVDDIILLFESPEQLEAIINSLKSIITQWA